LGRRPWRRRFARLDLPLARLHGALHTFRVSLVVLIGLRAYHLLARSGRLGSGPGRSTGGEASLRRGRARLDSPLRPSDDRAPRLGEPRAMLETPRDPEGGSAMTETTPGEAFDAMLALV